MSQQRLWVASLQAAGNRAEPRLVLLPLEPWSLWMGLGCLELVIGRLHELRENQNLQLLCTLSGAA